MASLTGSGDPGTGGGIAVPLTMSPKGGERRARPVSRSLLVHGFILAILVIYAAPMIGVALTSLQSNAEIAARGVWHIPENASLANFQDVMANTPLPRYLLNSFLVTIPATFFSVMGGVLLGYVFSQFRFPFAELIFLARHRGHVLPAPGHAHPALPALQRSHRDRRLPGPAGPLRHDLSHDHHPRRPWAWPSPRCSCATS